MTTTIEALIRTHQEVDSNLGNTDQLREENHRELRETDFELSAAIDREMGARVLFTVLESPDQGRLF